MAKLSGFVAGDTLKNDKGELGTVVEKDGQIEIEWTKPEPAAPANRQQRRVAEARKRKGRPVQVEPISDERALEIFVENQNLKGHADRAMMNLQQFMMTARRGFAEILRLVEDRFAPIFPEVRRLATNAMGGLPQPYEHSWKEGRDGGAACGVCGMLKEFESEQPTCLGVPQAECPACGAEQDDHDGMGVFKCLHCDYCSHASRTDGVCGFCGKKEETNGVGDDGTTDRRNPEEASEPSASGGSREEPARSDSPVLP